MIAYVSRAAAQGLESARSTLADMDQILPLEVRKKGLAIAMAKSKAAPAPSSSKKPAPPKQVAKAAPKPPLKAAKAPPPAAPAATGSWRIQLGAFSQRSSAEALYKKLSGKAALTGRQAFYVPTGSVTRLQIGPFESKAAAASACRVLGQACFPVPAK